MDICSSTIFNTTFGTRQALVTRTIPCVVIQQQGVPAFSLKQGCCQFDTYSSRDVVSVVPIPVGLLPVWYLLQQGCCQCGTYNSRNVVSVVTIPVGLLPVWYLLQQDRCQCGTYSAHIRTLILDRADKLSSIVNMVASNGDRWQFLSSTCSPLMNIC